MEHSDRIEGRESRRVNDLFFTCSLIEYIARKTKNKRADVVNALGRKNIEKIYELADVYHSDNIDRVSDDFIQEAGIVSGSIDDYNSSFYYDAPGNILNAWLYGEIE